MKVDIKNQNTGNEIMKCFDNFIRKCLNKAPSGINIPEGVLLSHYAILKANLTFRSKPLST